MHMGAYDYGFPDMVEITPRYGSVNSAGVNIYDATASAAGANAPPLDAAMLTPEQAAILFPPQLQPPLTPVQQAILGPNIPPWIIYAGLGLLVLVAMANRED